MTRRPTLLIVDDDAAVRAALLFAFELDGFRVETCADAAALKSATLADVGCIVIDHDLPHEDGLSLLQGIKRERPDLPVILTITQPKRRVLAAAARAGIPVVEKPLLTDALSQCVHKMLEKAQ
jgi:DNA-binding NtrC family response regulator